MDTGNNNMHMIRDLVKWWWNTTNTFNLLFREMILTLTDFTMITKFQCSGPMVEFLSKMIEIFLVLDLYWDSL